MFALSDLKYETLDIPSWVSDRVEGDSEGSIKTTLEEYYYSFLGSIGTKKAGIAGEKSFHEIMVNNLQGLSDGVSAVSLDEEMANLIKYQHAYSAASKLIRVADEMLNTLLNMK